MSEAIVRKPGSLSHEDAAPGKTLYAQGYAWRPSRGQKTAVSTAYYATSEEADEALRTALRQMGYTKPEWWEFWRWGESKNPALKDF